MGIRNYKNATDDILSILKSKLPGTVITAKEDLTADFWWPIAVEIGNQRKIIYIEYAFIQDYFASNYNNWLNSLELNYLFPFAANGIKIYRGSGASSPTYSTS